MLGENPQGPDPLYQILVCETWLRDEILDSIFPSCPERFALDKDKLNRLLLNCKRQPVTEHFYRYFFGTSDTLESFEKGVESFRIKAMLLYGNLHFAFKRLGTLAPDEFNREIKKTEPRSPTELETREPFDEMEEIPVADLGLLGYISGKQKIADLEMSLEMLELIQNEYEKAAQILSKIGEEKQKKVSDTLSQYDVFFPISGLCDLTLQKLSPIVVKTQGIVASLRSRQKRAVSVGLKNTHRYLTLPYLDVYVATSMRTQQDYANQHCFIEEVFNSPMLKGLHLRYFDPTISYAENRITKGLIEMLMLRRAKVTIYTASSEDTLGKDSELAATLAQGKPVIAYVPSGLDSKADLLRVDHPLGLQIDIRTGVAHGIVVVRSPEDCAKMLRKVILRERTFEIQHEKGNFLLVDTETKSVVRVVSDDPYLTHAFWTFFHHREDN